MRRLRPRPSRSAHNLSAVAHRPIPKQCANRASVPSMPRVPQTKWIGTRNCMPTKDAPPNLTTLPQAACTSHGRPAPIARTAKCRRAAASDCSYSSAYPGRWRNPLRRCAPIPPFALACFGGRKAEHRDNAPPFVSKQPANGNAPHDALPQYSARLGARPKTHRRCA